MVSLLSFPIVQLKLGSCLPFFLLEIECLYKMISCLTFLFQVTYNSVSQTHVRYNCSSIISCLSVSMLTALLSLAHYFLCQQCCFIRQKSLTSGVRILSYYFNLVGEYWLATQVLLYDVHNCVVLLVFIMNKDLTVDQ